MLRCLLYFQVLSDDSGRQEYDMFGSGAGRNSSSNYQGKLLMACFNYQ